VSGARDALERLVGPGAVDAAPARFDGPEVPRVAPASVEEMVEVVRFAAREKLRLIPIGTGSKLGWTAPANRVDFLLSTRAFSGIVSYEPGDGTLSARAGTPMASIRRAAAEGGHWVTPDVARPGRASLGGVLAASQSGPDRLRFGPARHHVLGMRVLSSDGSVTKSGGQLVKNVTGYDLHRLYCGSHGTLCIVLEASLRLFPAPEHEIWMDLVLDGDDDACARAWSALDLPVRTVSLGAARAGDAWSLSARLFGKRAPVENEAEQLLAVWPGARVCAGDEARRCAERERDQDGDGPWLHVTAPPPALPEVLSLLPGEAPLRVQPGIAAIDLPLPAPWRDSPAQRVSELRAALKPVKGRVAARDFKAEALAELDPFAEPGAGIELMRALKRKLDPGETFATGRFHGRI
jgi:glycolate oxidase FAD binding subunit